ncbi:hypothetical protein SNE40_001894 [Patella caerulea]|uniref:Hexosyltransferase n=1 Tax=Patella caerulea TaxID=87958 RepID=A0AAN8K4U5_PATCE
MIIPRLKKKHILIAAAFSFIFIWRQSYVISGPDLFHDLFDDNRTHDYKYLIKESEICKPFPDKIFLLITVFSRTSEFEEREAIRQTWGSLAVDNTEIRLAFILGYRPETNYVDLLTESEKYHDILQEDFYDSYRNLTIKSEAILRFANTFCQGVKYILKVDSDVFINIPLLIEELRKHDGRNMIMGNTELCTLPFRNPKSKWYVDKITYPHAHFPRYAQGHAYVLSGDITSQLLSVALKTKYLFLEDTFITGIVRERAAVKLINHRGFDYWSLFLDSCWFKNRISGHYYTKEQIREIWLEQDQNKLCTWSLRIFYALCSQTSITLGLFCSRV